MTALVPEDRPGQPVDDPTRTSGGSAASLSHRSRTIRAAEFRERRAMQFSYDETKFTEMVLYIADRLRDDRAGGATKLNKVLYFADFVHVRRHGRPISGAEYQKLAQGPAPRRLRPVRDRLVAAGDAEVVVEDFLGHDLHRLVPRRDADPSVFDAEELATIDKVLADLVDMTAKQVSDLSHEETGWRLCELGETIPYQMAFVSNRQVITPTARRLAREAAERHGIPTSA
jgi:hypothetical protein